MADIFLSYARQDQDRARVVAERLETAGLSVWWDSEIPPGKTWADVVAEALRAARCVVSLWSHASVESIWVQKEARFGEKEGILVPALIDNVEPPFEFEHIQAAKLFGWDGSDPEESFSRLLHGIEMVAGAPVTGTPADRPAIALATAETAPTVVVEAGETNSITLRGHEDTLWGAVFSPDGERIITASVDGTARVWSTRERGLPVVLRGHREQIWTAVPSPDGNRVVTASTDGTARVWQADGSGDSIVLVGHTEHLSSATFSPDGRWILTASDDDTARVWASGGDPDPMVLRGHADPLWCALFSPDGMAVATASDDGTARVWPSAGEDDTTRWTHFRPESRVLRGHEGHVFSVRFSPAGDRIVTASADWTARIWPLEEDTQPVILRGHEDQIFMATFSPDGTAVATASIDGTARLWPAAGNGEPVVLGAHKGEVESVAFSADGARIVTASLDGTAIVWRTDGGAVPETVLRGHDDGVRSAQFSPDGGRVVTASEDGTARVWDLTA
ncbi:MAG: toll/interleukin-1 receptor domain-containing protein [Gemmatimonadota bacterium]